jgi:CRISPR-associated protein Csd1
MALFESPDQVQELFESVHAGKEYHGIADTNTFYLLCLSGNSARAIVRDYLEAPLGQVKQNLSRWFHELSIASLSREDMGKPTCRFPLWLLAAATAMDMDQVAPDIFARLLNAALKGTPLPGSVLANCIGRLRADGSKGFRPARLALIKLTLLRRNIQVTETLNSAERHPAYLCGRLLAVLEQIQYAALGDVNASVVDKYFGTFSAAPAVVLGRLYSNAQNHLRKLRSDKPGLYFNLDKRLAELSSLLPEPPQGQLSLEDQGRFALGYYHQKAKRYAEIAERKAAIADKAQLNDPNNPSL